MARIAVTGSVAFDTIMGFPGLFRDSILPGKTDKLSVSFLVESKDRRRGGTAANVAYTLGLLGEHPLLAAAVGRDFDAYGAALAAAGVDLSMTLRCPDLDTASSFITTDLENNQITAFYPGAMTMATHVDVTSLERGDWVLVTPDDPAAMAVHVQQAVACGLRLVFSPAQQLPRLSPEVLRRGIESAWLVVGNEYEMGLIEAATGQDAAALGRDRIVAVTLGSRGSRLYGPEGTATVPIARATHVVDPTGAGDAYLGGLVAGLARGLSLTDAGRVGALAATYVVEVEGPQGQTFSREQFAQRYVENFATSLSL